MTHQTPESGREFPSRPTPTPDAAVAVYGYTDRRLDVDGISNNISTGLRPRAREGQRTGERAREEDLLCTWREACRATDYVLEHFGNRERDRGLWVWYCRRIGLDTFLDIADETISSWKQHELKFPIRAFQRHLMDAYPKGGAK